MGIIKAVSGAVGGTLADQWKEFFFCESISNDVLMLRAQKQVSERSSNTKGSDNYISDGSVIALADGQSAVVTDMGKIIAVFTEPGENVFTRNGSGVGKFFGEVWDRIGYGGDVHHVQRVMYINTKEIPGNYFKFDKPVQVRITDENIGVDIDCSVVCSGMYSFRITDPEVFYKNAGGNIGGEYPRSRLIGMMKAEFISSLRSSMAQIASEGFRPSKLPECVDELNAKSGKLMSDRLSRFGITICSVAIESVALDSKDAEHIKAYQFTGMLRDPEMAAAYLLAAQAEAMVTASGNAAGAAAGLFGYTAAAQNPFLPQKSAVNPLLTKSGSSENPLLPNRSGQNIFLQPKQPAEAQSDEWQCECGNVNKSGNFCTECGKKRK